MTNPWEIYQNLVTARINFEPWIKDPVGSEKFEETCLAVRAAEEATWTCDELNLPPYGKDTAWHASTCDLYLRRVIRLYPMDSQRGCYDAIQLWRRQCLSRVCLGVPLFYSESCLVSQTGLWCGSDIGTPVKNNHP